MKTLLFLCAVASLAAATPAGAAYIYSPTGVYETSEGSSNRGVFIPGKDVHVQWRYDGAIFGSDPLLINGVSFRYDRAYHGAVDQTGVFDLDDRFSVKLAVLDGTFSSVFADNLDGAVTAMSGARKLPFLTGAPAGQTKPFGVHLMFDKPFRYDPADGDLIIDMFTPAQGNWGTFDFTTSDLHQGLFTMAGSAASGQKSYAAPVTRFDVSPMAVPEPAAWALMILGFGGAGAALRRTRAYARA